MFADALTEITLDRMRMEGWKFEVINGDSAIVSFGFTYQKEYGRAFTFPFGMVVQTNGTVQFWHLIEVQWAMMMARLKFERMLDGYPAFCSCSYAPNPDCLFHGSIVRRHLAS